MTENGETATKQVETTTKARSFIDLPTRFDRWEPLAEVIATLVLALATVATAWSGYQSARWGGEQSTKYSQAGALRTESTRASNQAGQLTQIDIGLFTNWINAYAGGDERLINFYEKRFRDEFKPAFDAWVATDPANNPDAPKSPFAMPEYQVSLTREAERLEVEASETFAKGQVANQTSDDYILNTVFLASVMFLGGIASRFSAISARWVLILFSLAILTLGLYNILTYPIR